MKLVQPIRNKEIVNQMGEVLKEMNDKYYVMFRIGVTSGLRISDILNIKVKDNINDYNIFWCKNQVHNFLKNY